MWRSAPLAHSHVVSPRTAIIRQWDFKLFCLQLIVGSGAPCQGMVSCVDVSSTAVHLLSDGLRVTRLCFRTVAFRGLVSAKLMLFGAQGLPVC